MSVLLIFDKNRKTSCEICSFVSFCLEYFVLLCRILEIFVSFVLYKNKKTRNYEIEWKLQRSTILPRLKESGMSIGLKTDISSRNPMAVNLIR